MQSSRSSTAFMEDLPFKDEAIPFVVVDPETNRKFDSLTFRVLDNS